MAHRNPELETQIIKAERDLMKPQWGADPAVALAAMNLLKSQAAAQYAANRVQQPVSKNMPNYDYIEGGGDA